MENKIQERLQKLRQLMKKKNLSAFIFPSTDLIKANIYPTIGKVVSGFRASMVLQEQQ